MNTTTPTRAEILRKALASRVLFFDGGMGTQLQAHGLTAGEPSELWSLSHPEVLTAIHRAYLEAGANILCANTFGVNGLKYPASGEVTAEKLVKAAVACAKEAIRAFEADHAGEPAAAEPHLIALDMGPTGRLMAPLGDLTTETAVEAFGASVRAAAEAGADLVAVETMNDVSEARAAVLAAKTYAEGMPVIATVVFSEQGRLLTGTDVSSVVVSLASLGVDALGLNCSLGPDKMKKMVPALASQSPVPVSVSPNAGLPITVNGVTTYPCGPDDFTREMLEVYHAGARVLGGCCGTTPEHIAALRAALAGEDLNTSFAPAPMPRLLSGRLTTVDPCGEETLIYPLTPDNQDVAYDLLDALADEDWDSVGDAALDAVDEDASILLLSVAAEGVDEVVALPRSAAAVQAVASLPLILASEDPAALDAALKVIGGRAGVLIPAGQPVPDEIAAVAAKYGALLLTREQLPGLMQI